MNSFTVTLRCKFSRRLFIVVASLCLAPAWAGSLDIHLSPTGSDAAEGRTPNDPIATLGRAQEIVAAKAAGHDEVRVLFAPGVYQGQNVVWKTFPGIWIRFMPAVPKAKVVFDGRTAKESVFFRGAPPDPTQKTKALPMKLEFRSIVISHYCEGISLRSWSDDVRVPGGQENIIRENIFENIGSKYDPVVRKGKRRGGCTAALRLMGVENNLVENNVFNHIINIDKKDTTLSRYGPAHLHAIYIANMSSGNRIINNKFDDFSGDPVRIRDKSDRNKVEDNIFGSASANTKPGDIYAISQWYCNDSIEACLTRYANRKECPSEAIEYKGNVIKGRGVAEYANRAVGKPTCSY